MQAATMQLGIDATVGPGEPWLGRLPAGAMIRIVDLHGQQAVDFLCYDAHRLSNRYNAGNTIKLNGSVYLKGGHVLYSDEADALMTIVLDTVGRHDTIAGCCSASMNRLRYKLEGTPNCRDIFTQALAHVGGDTRDIPANVNFFMNVPIASDGRTAIAEGLSKPGDLVELRCERDVLVVLSNCPQQSNPCSGGQPTPIRVTTWMP